MTYPFNIGTLNFFSVNAPSMTKRRNSTKYIQYLVVLNKIKAKRIHWQI